jgi:uncharacterized DUF497 family protein
MAERQLISPALKSRLIILQAVGVFIDSIIWDLPDDPDGNVAHIAENGLTVDDVEEVLLNPLNPVDRGRSSGRPMTFGYLQDGRRIAVVWELVDDMLLTVRPVTAYEVDE